jgi:hypothetical protein
MALAAFERAWQEGELMTLQEALAFGLDRSVTELTAGAAPETDLRLPT